MADVFAVSLHALSDDNAPPLQGSQLSGMNGTSAVSEIAGGANGLLSLLTVIGTSLSIVGVVLAFITYSLFSNLRTVSGTALLNLLAALFLAHLISVVGVERTPDKGLCLTVAFLLHYLWLSVQCWLAVMARDMHHTFRDNINLQPTPASEKQKSFLRCAFFAWGFPGVCIGIAAVLHFYLGADSEPLLNPTCVVIGRNSFLLSFALPFCLLSIAEVSYFIRAAVVIRYTSSLQVNRKARDKMRRRRYLQLFLYAKIMLLLLFTWICCLIAQFGGVSIFWFTFTVLNSLMGFFVSLAYSCNSRVFRLYTKSLRTSRPDKLPSYGSSELSQSTSLALLTWQPTPDAV